MTDRISFIGTITITFVIAFILTILPLPQWAQWFRPDWVMLGLIYWTMMLPERFGLGCAFIIGLLLDTLHGALLGQYALVAVVISFLTCKLHYQLRSFPLWQQTFIIFLLLSIGDGLLVWIDGIRGEIVVKPQYWIPALTSALIWPWIFILLGEYQKRFRV
jgi:rod shape-determining protein MreD